MDKLEKICQEIERRRDFFYERFLKKGIGCVEESRYDECVEILSFIDSLPDCTVCAKGNGRVKDEVFDTLSDEPDKNLEEEIEMEWDSFNKHLAKYDDGSEEVVWLNRFSFVDIANYFYELGLNVRKEESK